MADGQEQDQNQDKPKQPGVGSGGNLRWDCVKPSKPMGKLGSQAVRYKVKALVASDPENNTPHEAL